MNLTNLYKLALSDDWQIARAMAIVESGEQPFAVGDHNLAWGLWQMHATFFDTYCSTDDSANRGSAFDQAVALSCFWYRHRDLPIAQRLQIFHYGHLDDNDPDSYVRKVASAYLGRAAAADVDAVVREWNASHASR